MYETYKRKLRACVRAESIPSVRHSAILRIQKEGRAELGRRHRDISLGRRVSSSVGNHTARERVQSALGGVGVWECAVPHVSMPVASSDLLNVSKRATSS